MAKSLVERTKSEEPKVTVIGGVEYYTPPNAAKLLGVSRATVVRWIKDGAIEAYRRTYPIRGDYFIRKETWDRLVSDYLVPVKISDRSDLEETINKQNQSASGEHIEHI